MAVDRNSVINLRKSGKGNVEIAIAGCEWFNGVEDRDEVLGYWKHPGQTWARKKTECPLSSTFQKHQGKAGTKLSPKLPNLCHRIRYEQIHNTQSVEGRSGGEALKDAASPGAYGQSCGHEHPKIKGNPSGDG